MREAGAEHEEVVVVLWVGMCPPHRGYSWSHHPPPLPPSPSPPDAPHKRNLLDRGEGAMAVPLWLHPGTSKLDNVPYIKTSGPGHLLVSRIPYPPTRTKVLLLFALGHRVDAAAREFPAKLTLLSGSQMPAFTIPTNKNKAEVSCYRIPYSPQKHTVPSYKCLLPPASSRCHDESLLTKDLQIMRFLRCLVSRKDIPYSTTSFSVPCYKLYRTLLQALPYSPARNTVLTSKEYRTLPQNMTYPATKAARNVPAKLGKYVGERSERPVCVYC